MTRCNYLDLGRGSIGGRIDVCIGQLSALASSEKPGSHTTSSEAAKIATTGCLNHSTKQADHCKDAGHSMRWNYEGDQEQSERADGSEQTSMEMHLDHKNAEGQLEVADALMKFGRTNTARSKLWGHKPQSTFKTHMVDGILSITGIWFVLDTPIAVHIEQVKRFADSAGFNARPLQPKSRRLVIAPIKNN